MIKPITSNDDVTIFAETNYRNIPYKFGIKRKDRRNHMYLIGKTGMGKSTLMENMIYSDMYAGEGLAVIDPHGDLVQKVLAFIPEHRRPDLIYFNPADLEHPLAFNVLERPDRQNIHLIASGLISVFKKIWIDSWGPRLEYILRNTILALLEFKDATLLDVQRLLVDKAFRTGLVSMLRDEQVRDFWLKEFEAYSPNFRTEAISPVQNKLGQFTSSKIIRNIIGQKQSSFNLKTIMDESRILLVDLSKGKIGEDAARLLGSLLLTQIELHALQRSKLPENERRDFYLYCDEFYSFTSASFAGILSEARKYKLNLILANQFIEQLDENLCAAIFGNVGTIVSFRVGARDAEYLVKEFSPTFTQEDLVNLPQHQIILKLMVDGITAQPFSAVTLPPYDQPQSS